MRNDMRNKISKNVQKKYLVIVSSLVFGEGRISKAFNDLASAVAYEESAKVMFEGVGALVIVYLCNTNESGQIDLSTRVMIDNLNIV